MRPPPEPSEVVDGVSNGTRGVFCGLIRISRPCYFYNTFLIECFSQFHLLIQYAPQRGREDALNENK